MMTDFRGSWTRRSNAHQERWPGARNSGPSWASPAITNGRIAVVSGAAVIDDAGMIIVAAVVIGVGCNRSRGGRSDSGNRTDDAHGARFSRGRDGSRERRGSDKHQGNLLHWRPLCSGVPIDGYGSWEVGRSIRLTANLNGPAAGLCGKGHTGPAPT